MNLDKAAETQKGFKKLLRRCGLTGIGKTNYFL
jgi:hypothetical protein